MTWSNLGIVGLAMLAVGTTAAAESTAGGTWSFALDADVDVRYDDNILSGADEDIFRISNPAPGDEGRYGVETPDDMILSPALRIRFDRVRPRSLRTSIYATLRAYEYQTNSIKDSQSYTLSLRQELNRSRKHGSSLRVRIGYIPYYFLRNLIDDDESIAAGAIVRNSLDYNKGVIGVELTQTIVHRRLRATIGYDRERRNYNQHFNERDSDSDVISLDLDIYPLDTLAFRVRPYYGYERRIARGDLPETEVVDDDVGFDSNLLGVDVRWRWGRDADHRHEISVWYENEVRDFTTLFTPDTAHFGREDDISQYGLDYEKEFGRHWQLYVEARHRVNDSSHPDPFGGTRTTPYEKTVTGMGFRYSY